MARDGAVGCALVQHRSIDSNDTQSSNDSSIIIGNHHQHHQRHHPYQPQQHHHHQSQLLLLPRQQQQRRRQQQQQPLLCKKRATWRLALVQYAFMSGRLHLLSGLDTMSTALAYSAPKSPLSRKRRHFTMAVSNATSASSDSSITMPPARVVLCLT